jgi:hypothetical protein
MSEHELMSAKYLKTEEPMAETESHTTITPRKFGQIDAGRCAIFLILLIGAFAAWFFILQWIQFAILPKVAGGERGPWLIRPIIALHFCACAITSMLSVPFLMKRFRDRWNARDAAVGTKYDPFCDRPGRKVGLMLKGGALALIYAAALPFYLYSWTIVTPGGIELQSPWGHRNYTFTQVRSLQIIPAGMRSDKLRKNGPWYQVEFADGRNFTFSSDNEGSRESEQSAIATFIAKHTGRSWQVYRGAHRR